MSTQNKKIIKTDCSKVASEISHLISDCDWVINNGKDRNDIETIATVATTKFIKSRLDLILKSISTK